MSNGIVAIVGAGPYGLALSAHLAARNITHRIFGQPMRFWSQIAAAGPERYLKSFCFGTDIASPRPGFTFADYSRPRGLETFEPCSMRDFAAYGKWFQQNNVPWVEPLDVLLVEQVTGGFEITLANGEHFHAARVIVATGLARYEHMPRSLASLPANLTCHTSQIDAFAAFAGRRVAVIGAGQSALEAAALLHEAGARPQLLIRDETIRWHTRTLQERNLWRRLRSPISKLGTGPKAWALTRFPGGPHRLPQVWRTRFVKRHLPAEGAWWLRERVEKLVPTHFRSTIAGASVVADGVELHVRGDAGKESSLSFDHVVAGTGYVVDVEQLSILDERVRSAIRRIDKAPRLDKYFQTSVAGLHFIGTASAASFGPLFRFVVGADYTARVLSSCLAN